MGIMYATHIAYLTSLVLDGPHGTRYTVRDAWFSLALDDAGSLQQLLATAALHLESAQNGHKEPRETPLSLQFHTMSIRSVRERLQNSSFVATDGMITAVIGLLAYDVRREKPSYTSLLNFGRNSLVIMTAGLCI
jgi:hypothetical protein